LRLLIGYVTHPIDAPDPGPWTTIELALALADDPGYTDEVSGVLERWHVRGGRVTGLPQLQP